MAIDPDEYDVVRQALADSDSLDAAGIQVTSEDDTLVLRGSVSTYEEASAAVAIAEQHADDVRSELAVDVNLREGVDAGEALGDRTRTESLQGSSFNPVEEQDDLVDDMQESLEENLPWDPPHEPVEVPTRAESRGVAVSITGDEDALLEEREGTKSLADMTPEELSRAAHPEPRDEENV